MSFLRMHMTTSYTHIHIHIHARTRTRIFTCMIFIIFRYSAFHAVCSHNCISNTRNAWERKKETERERKWEREGREENERDEQKKMRESNEKPNKFIVDPLYRLSFSKSLRIPFSWLSHKFSTLNMSRSTHERCSRLNAAIASFGPHACHNWRTRIAKLLDIILDNFASD